MSKEKELEELTGLLFANDMILLSRDSCKKQALVIQNLGYTKSHFPIEKLEEWLGNGQCHFSHISKREMLQLILDYIQKLKGDIEEEG